MWPSRKLPDQALASLRSNRQIGCAREAFGSLPAGNRSWQLTGRASLNPTARIGHPTRATLTSIPERLANAFEDSFLFSRWLIDGGLFAGAGDARADRKSTRLNSSHRCISYAVFCLKK